MTAGSNNGVHPTVVERAFTGGLDGSRLCVGRLMPGVRCRAKGSLAGENG